MLNCWEANIERRICFNDIISKLVEEVGKGYVIESLDDDHHDYTLIKDN